MKKIYILLLASILVMNLHAEIVLLNGLYYSLSSTTAQVAVDQTTDQSRYSTYTSVTIPATVTYNGYTYAVTSMASQVFQYCTLLESVTLPPSIKSISSDAFYGCNRLASVNLDEGLISIGARAFDFCNLSSVTIPSTVTSIGSSAFQNNPLTSVVWKAKECSVGTDTYAPFYSTNSQITSFTFGDSVEVVPAHICKKMTRLDTIVLPPSVRSLGQYSFAFCSSLKSINLPVTQKSLPTSIFEGCTALESIVLPATLTTINQDAFYGCNRLASINLHEGITTIGLRAFEYCKLTSVTIPSTVTSIGSYAFQNNPLTSVIWLPKDCSIGTDTYAPFYSTNSQITSFTFGDSVEVVPAHICKKMTRLDTIVLPPSVRSLGQYAFAFCSSLKSINLPVTQKSLPTSIFEGCTALESIVLPATLTTINQDAFYGCNRLASINLHEGITTIGLRAFDYCKLTSVTIPSTVTSIGNYAFQNNPLTSVIWLPKTCSTGSDTYAPFYSTNSQITSFTFGDSVQTIPGYLCCAMNKLDSISLPAQLRTIGQYAFKSCTKLRSIAIPATVTSIGQCAFMYCTQLRFFEFPSGITTLATSVLEGCTALEQVIIPESVTSINQDAFYGCSALLAIYNYALTPQTIVARTLYNVSRANCVLYVPMDYIDLYQSKAVWCDFTNIIGLATGLHFEDQLIPVSYLKQDSTLHFMEVQHWQVPLAPRIQGFTFLRWEVLPGDLADGIVLKAIYRSDAPTGNAPAVVTDPANPARKLIRNGQIYILSDDKTYTIQGHRVE